MFLFIQQQEIILISDTIEKFYQSKLEIKEFFEVLRLCNFSPQKNGVYSWLVHLILIGEVFRPYHTTMQMTEKIYFPISSFHPFWIQILLLSIYIV